MNNDDMKKGKELIICIIAACLTGILFFFSILLVNALPGEEYVFAQGDALLQTAAFARMLTRNLITGGSLDFSFEMGLGMETSAVYAFYAQSPMNFLFLLIEDPAIAVFWITFLKLVLGAAFMALAIQRITKWKSVLVAGLASAYALCAFSMNLYIALFLLDIIYLFPLLILGVKCFVDDGKMIRLILLYAICFMVQFYCAYIMGVCSFVAYLAYGWYHYGKDWKVWRKSFLKYCVCVLTAVLISAPVTLPAAEELFAYRLEDSTGFQAHVLYPWDFIKGLYPHKGEGAYNSMPLLYAGLSSLFLSFVFFFDPEVDKKKKIVVLIPALFLTISCFWAPLYRFMHAFDAPDGYDYRFSPCFSFLMVLVASLELKNVQRRAEKRFWGLPVAAGLGIMYFLLFWIERSVNGGDHQVLDLRSGLIVVLLLSVYSLCFIHGGRVRGLTGILLVVLSGEIIFHNGLALQGSKSMR